MMRAGISCVVRMVSVPLVLFHSAVDPKTGGEHWRGSCEFELDELPNRPSTITVVLPAKVTVVAIVMEI